MRRFGIAQFAKLAVLIVSAVVSQYAVAKQATAIFAGGCFWCSEKDFEQVPGVITVESGYTGGTQENPTYKQVSSGSTGHTEAVRVTYNPDQVNYDTLLKVFWYSIDPYAKDRQFCDAGTQYRSAIYYANSQQREQAFNSLKRLKQLHYPAQKIYTELSPAVHFWPAEEYHQDYYKKNPLRYRYYRYSCGRDQRLQTLWKEQAGWKPANANKNKK